MIARMAKVDLSKKRPNRITELRLEQGLSSQKLADLAGTTQGTIHHLETGRRQLTQHWMTLIADALGVHPSDLLPEHKAGQGKVDSFRQPISKGMLKEPAKEPVGQLERLAKLYDEGKLTAAEFQKVKKLILKD